MKKYESPELIVTKEQDADILTVSLGDTPLIEWEWQIRPLMATGALSLRCRYKSCESLSPTIKASAFGIADIMLKPSGEAKPKQTKLIALKGYISLATRPKVKLSLNRKV